MELPYRVKESYGERIRNLGAGTHGQVWLYSDWSMVHAIKSINRYCTDEAIVELSAMIQFKHRNLINLIDLIEINEHIGLVMPVALGDLEHSLGGLNEFDRRSITYQMLAGVAYLHHHDLLHCDLKPANLLLFRSASNYIVKIIDFGLTRQFHSLVPTTYLPAYTLWYRAPEVILNGRCDRPADIWSLGCIIYWIFSKKHIFESNNEEQAMEQIVELLGHPGEHHLLARNDVLERTIQSAYQQPRRKPSFHGIDDDRVVTILQSILQYDPMSRPSAYELLQNTLFDDIAEVDLEYPLREYIVVMREKQRILVDGMARQEAITYRQLNEVQCWMLTALPSRANLPNRCSMVALHLLDEIVAKRNIKKDEIRLMGMIALYVAQIVTYQCLAVDDFVQQVYPIRENRFITELWNIIKLLQCQFIFPTAYDFGRVLDSEYGLTASELKVNTALLFLLMFDELRFKYLPEQLYEVSYHLTRWYFDRKAEKYLDEIKGFVERVRPQREQLAQTVNLDYDQLLR